MAIEKELTEWRRRINKYWFWDDVRELLPKERALECVIIGDTVSGDELVFHPSRPNRLFVLPRDSEQFTPAARSGPDRRANRNPKRKSVSEGPRQPHPRRITVDFVPRHSAYRLVC